MLPYAFTIIVLVLGSREAIRKRLGSPVALGLPYIRGERGL
jgi:simple sugar transport system permease protein